MPGHIADLCLPHNRLQLVSPIVTTTNLDNPTALHRRDRFPRAPSPSRTETGPSQVPSHVQGGCGTPVSLTRCFSVPVYSKGLVFKREPGSFRRKFGLSVWNCVWLDFGGGYLLFGVRVHRSGSDAGELETLDSGFRLSPKLVQGSARAFGLIGRLSLSVAVPWWRPSDATDR